MDLTREILFNDHTQPTDFTPNLPTETDSSEETFETPQDLVYDVEDEFEDDSTPEVSIDIEPYEICIEHSLDSLIIDTRKLKDLTMKSLLTKYKDNLGIVTKISSDSLTVLFDNSPFSLEAKAQPGHFYTVFTEHQVKG